MSSVSTAQAIEMLDRLERNRTRQPASEAMAPAERSGCDREGKLHQDIKDWCGAQWPVWTYSHSRFGVRSTLDVAGVSDFLVFAPGGRFFCIECKKKDGKLDPDQRDWAAIMARLGHTVHLVRSMDEFLTLTRPHAGEQPGHLGRGAESVYRGPRCGVCYWGLYDGAICQNAHCVLAGHDVGENRIELSNAEAKILIEAKAKGSS